MSLKTAHPRAQLIAKNNTIIIIIQIEKKAANDDVLLKCFTTQWQKCQIREGKIK